MPNLYILAADSSTARLYQADQRLRSLELIHQQDNPAGRLAPRELDSDRAGMQSGVAGIHSVGGEEDSQDHQTSEFARTLTRHLHSELVTGKFDGLMLVAPPQFLGVLRKNLSPECQKVLRKTVNKNLMQEREESLVAHLSK